MTTLYLILLLLAAICFGIAALIAERIPPRYNLVALGLFLWVMVPLLQTFKRLTD